MDLHARLEILFWYCSWMIWAVETPSPPFHICCCDNANNSEAFPCTKGTSRQRARVTVHKAETAGSEPYFWHSHNHVAYAGVKEQIRISCILRNAALGKRGCLASCLCCTLWLITYSVILHSQCI